MKKTTLKVPDVFTRADDALSSIKCLSRWITLGKILKPNNQRGPEVKLLISIFPNNRPTGKLLPPAFRFVILHDHIAMTQVAR